MKELSRIALGVEPSATMAIDTMFKQMKADGIDVIGFGAGEPDFPTPYHIKEAGIRAILNNDTKYTAAVGTVELREAIADRLRMDCGLDYAVNQIAVSNGAKPCVCTALMVLVNPGDEVIIPAPCWVSYVELVRMAGGVPVLVHAKEEAGFKITPEQLEEAITPKTKCMIFNNPSNPTGMMYNREQLEAIAKVCVEKDIYVISDEIYYSLVYDKKEFVSLASINYEIKRRTLLVNGVSKSYAMTGWRIGYVCCEELSIAKAIANYISHSTGSPCAISQKAAEGAFYVMMNIEKLIGKELFGTVITDDNVFGQLFLKYGKVAVVPGFSFEAPNFVRWSYAASMENIKEGMDRLEKFLKGEAV